MPPPPPPDLITLIISGAQQAYISCSSSLTVHEQFQHLCPSTAAMNLIKSSRMRYTGHAACIRCEMFTIFGMENVQRKDRCEGLGLHKRKISNVVNRITSCTKSPFCLTPPFSRHNNHYQGDTVHCTVVSWCLYLNSTYLDPSYMQLFNYFERPQNRYSSAVHKISTQYSFQVLSQNWEKRLLALTSVCPSVRPSVSMDGFSWNLSIFSKICR